MGVTIDYCGVIERMEGHHVFVKVVPQPACTGCKAGSMCMAAAGGKQIIEVLADEADVFHVNDPVTLSGQNSMGQQAVWLAFVIPLILVVAVILFTTFLQWEESISALTGLSLLFPYYIVLYLLRNTLKKTFVFTIKKLI